MATNKAISSKKSTAAKVNSTTSTVKSSQTAGVTYASFVANLKSMPLVGVMIAEFVGTFLLTAAFLEMQGNPLFVAFALTGVILIVGGISGAHLNPGMTVGAWATKKITWLTALGYVAAQFLGAAVAFLVLNTFLHANSLTSAQVAAGASTPSLYSAATITSGKEWYIFFAELLGSSILGLGVATALRLRKNKIVSAFTAGFAILIALYVAMSLTTVLLDKSGVSLTFLNPAVAMAANGFSWNIWPLAIYILAPVLGGVIGFVLHDFMHTQSDEQCDCEACKK